MKQVPCVGWGGVLVCKYGKKKEYVLCEYADSVLHNA